VALLAAAVLYVVHRVAVDLQYRWQWPVILQYLVRTDGGSWFAGA
jgi:hypothetical protein